MDKDALIIAAAAAVAAGIIWYTTSGRKTTSTSGAGTAGTLNNFGAAPMASEIGNTALPGQPGWGWKYYSDGTAIDPAGNYYMNGQLIYRGAGYLGA